MINRLVAAATLSLTGTHFTTWCYKRIYVCYIYGCERVKECELRTSLKMQLTEIDVKVQTENLLETKNG